jgi:nitrate reductase NapE component
MWHKKYLNNNDNNNDKNNDKNKSELFLFLVHLVCIFSAFGLYF